MNAFTTGNEYVAVCSRIFSHGLMVGTSSQITACACRWDLRPGMIDFPVEGNLCETHTQKGGVAEVSDSRRSVCLQNSASTPCVIIVAGRRRQKIFPYSRRSQEGQRTWGNPRFRIARIGSQTSRADAFIKRC